MPLNSCNYRVDISVLIPSSGRARLGADRGEQFDERLEIFTQRGG